MNHINIINLYNKSYINKIKEKTAAGCRVAVAAFLMLGLLTLNSCSKSDTEDYGRTLTPYQQYLPVVAGQLNFYNLDSIVAAPFGTAMDTVHYTAKDSIGVATIDGSDTTYPVYRYLKPGANMTGTGNWSYQLTYRLIFSEHTASLISIHNQRFIILTDPVKQDYSWDGNRYFTSDLNPGDFYYGWQYTYDLTGDGLLTVHQIDQTNGNPGAFDPSLYQEKLFAQLVFEKGIGLYSQQESHITYQANQNNPSAFGYYEQDSYGFILTRISVK